MLSFWIESGEVWARNTGPLRTNFRAPPNQFPPLNIDAPRLCQCRFCKKGERTMNTVESPAPEFDPDDLLRGAEAISRFIGLSRYQIDHLARNKSLPGLFKIGGRLFLRKSTFVKNIEMLESFPDAGHSHRRARK